MKALNRRAHELDTACVNISLRTLILLMPSKVKIEGYLTKRIAASYLCWMRENVPKRRRARRV